MPLSQSLATHQQGMVSLRFVITYVAFISFVTFVALFGHLPVLRPLGLGWLRDVMVTKLPRGLIALDRRLTGGRFGLRLQRQAHHLINEANNVTVYFYLTLYLGGCYVYFTRVAQELPWIPHIFIWPEAVLLPLTTLLVASKSQPGYITADTHTRELYRYPLDGVIFRSAPPPRDSHNRQADTSKSVEQFAIQSRARHGANTSAAAVDGPGDSPVAESCRSCHLPKPARSKHCNLCRRCVSRHDHHCIWINNCVGLYNLRFFLLFLLANCLTIGYAAGTCWWVLCRWKEREDGRPQLPGTLSPGAIERWIRVLRWDPLVGGLTILTTTGALLVIVFGLYHLYLACSGWTTNESLKFEDVTAAIDAATVWLVRRPHHLQQSHPHLQNHARLPPTQELPRPATQTASGSRPTRSRLSRLWRSKTHQKPTLKASFRYAEPGFLLVLPHDSRYTYTESDCADAGEYVLLYDRGWIRNLREVFWPERFAGQILPTITTHGDTPSRTTHPRTQSLLAIGEESPAVDAYKQS
ncbi:palmitoyltransferase swf1 [Savitreella phatthalungensis]